MNTADRSLAMVDYALRRRFSFVSLVPQFHNDKFRRMLREKGTLDTLVDKIVNRMSSLNEKIGNDNNLGDGYKIGHSYFCPDNSVKPDDKWYRDVIETEIAPS